MSGEICAEAPAATSSPCKAGPPDGIKHFNQCYMGISLPLSSHSLYPTATSFYTINNTATSLGDQDPTELQNDREKRGASLSYTEIDRVQQPGLSCHCTKLHFLFAAGFLFLLHVQSFEKLKFYFQLALFCLGEEPEVVQNLQLTSESDEELESEEGGGSRLEKDRGRWSRRSARSAVSNKGVRSHTRKRRERSSGLSYTEVRPYHHQISSCLVCSLRHSHQHASVHRERKISAGSYHIRARTGTDKF